MNAHLGQSLWQPRRNEVGIFEAGHGVDLLLFVVFAAQGLVVGLFFAVLGYETGAETSPTPIATTLFLVDTSQRYACWMASALSLVMAVASWFRWASWETLADIGVRIGVRLVVGIVRFLIAVLTS
jgi:hypothetical protein